VAPPLPLTGERTVPGLAPESYWFARHVVAYEAAAAGCRGRDVLDAGCGEGYGSGLLRSAGARRVVALDYDAATTRHAATSYPELAVLRGNLVALPLAQRAFDVVVSLQTVEHLWDQPGFVRECARVLRPGGRLVLTTPNRLTFPPGNVFHTRELDAAELRRLLAARLAGVDIRGVRHGARLAAWEAEHGSLVAAQLAAPPESWSPGLAALVASVTPRDFVVDDAAGDDALDLLATAVRR
jgi:SAM-dependent methyltransferase